MLHIIARFAEVEPLIDHPLDVARTRLCDDM
jgi:hypothetical protein